MVSPKGVSMSARHGGNPKQWEHVFEKDDGKMKQKDGMNGCGARGVVSGHLHCISFARHTIPSRTDGQRTNSIGRGTYPLMGQDTAWVETGEQGACACMCAYRTATLGSQQWACSGRILASPRLALPRRASHCLVLLVFCSKGNCRGRFACWPQKTSKYRKYHTNGPMGTGTVRAVVQLRAGKGNAAVLGVISLDASHSGCAEAEQLWQATVTWPMPGQRPGTLALNPSTW
ncbi:hypothetical protein GGI35DRAFT_162354 [Trichoderma velutinum]